MVFVRVEDGQPGTGTLSTDSLGRFYSPVSEAIQSLRLAVNLPGCQLFERLVVVNGREELRLVLQKLQAKKE
jgi:hypothetical protein